MIPDQKTNEGRNRYGLLVESASYVLFILVSILILIFGLKLYEAELSVPFEYDEDTLLILPLVKETVEGGHHWRNARLGAPGVQELYDFPIVDHLHFLLIRLMAVFTRDTGLIFNLYYLATYPLTVVTTMLVLRHFHLSLMAAGVGGLLYAFQPYHYLRGEHHYFLSAYFVVPLSAMLALNLCRGQYRVSLRSWDAVAVLLVAVATGSAGAYYAFFACALYLLAGCYGWALTGTWRVLASALLLIGVVVIVGAANHAPTFLYQWKNGHSATHVRHPFEAEHHGMKLTHLVLPVTGHQSRALADLRATYNNIGRPLEHENRDGCLGLIGTIGFGGLFVALFLPNRRPWPLGPLAALTALLVLVGTIGGLGSLVSFLVTPQVRAYNRVSIYIAFFALFAVLATVDRLLQTSPRFVRVLLLVLLAAVGLWDELARPWFRSDVADARTAVMKRYQDDGAFFGQIEQAVPGGMVFMLPYVKYPEDYSTPLAGGYVLNRGYLHTRTVRWSFGAMKGREVDLVHRHTVTLPPDEMLLALIVQGFDGLFIDTRGYPPTVGEKLVSEIQLRTGNTTPPLRHVDGLQVFLDLRSFKARLEADRPGELAALRLQGLEQLQVLWLHGFVSFEPVGQESKHRWCGRRGELVLANPIDRTRRFQCTMVFGNLMAESADLKIDGAIWSDRFPVNRDVTSKTYTIVVPPGRHTIRFICKPPAEYRPSDTLEQIFFVAQFEATEIP